MRKLNVLGDVFIADDDAGRWYVVIKGDVGGYLLTQDAGTKL